MLTRLICLLHRIEWSIEAVLILMINDRKEKHVLLYDQMFIIKHCKKLCCHVPCPNTFIQLEAYVLLINARLK